MLVLVLVCTWMVEVAPYWNVNHNADAFLNDLENVEVAPYWNVNCVYLSCTSITSK